MRPVTAERNRREQVQSCSKCRITIRGNKICCPLCKGELTGEPERPAFPVLKPQKVSTVSAFRVCAFICVIVEIVAGIAFYGTAFTAAWCIPVMGIALLLLFDFAVALYFKGNFLKLITAQFYIGMLVCYLADMRTGGSGWSVTWVIPLSFVVLTLVIFIIGGITRGHLMEYVIYIFLNSLLSLLLIIPVRSGLNTSPMPALICVGIMIAVAAFILIFRMRDLINASSRYLSL